VTKNRVKLCAVIETVLNLVFLKKNLDFLNIDIPKGYYEGVEVQKPSNLEC
jgi:hypothetical protein